MHKLHRNMKAVSLKVDEQYEFKGWLITIQNWYGTDQLQGFAVPTKYSHILDIDNYMFCNEIAKENGIVQHIDETGEIYYEDSDFDWIVAEPDDAIVRLATKFDTKSASMLLDYFVRSILQIVNPPKNNYEREMGYKLYDDTKYIVLKQVKKRTEAPKVSKRKSGFYNLAWASMVKLRDGKCTECGSVYDLHAHHIKQYKSYPDLRYDVNNGITLCAVCHREHHKTNGR